MNVLVGQTSKGAYFEQFFLTERIGAEL